LDHNVSSKLYFDKRAVIEHMDAYYITQF